MRPEITLSFQDQWLIRLRLVCTPHVVRKALLAAGIVGVLLVGLNQGDPLVSGQVNRWVLVKSLLTPIIPFCVTMLGAFLNTGSAMCAEVLRPGWATVRRSLVIALCVGSAIVGLNQGDVLLTGTIPPLVLMKVLVTPCVPFCISLFGAYTAYWSALAAQQKATGMT